LVRAFVGGAALLAGARRSLSEVAAQDGLAGPGEPCRTSDQCVAADAPMICDWNGYGNGTNCCTYEGSNCADDSWCCWSNLCIGGICTDPNALAGDSGATDSGLNQTGYGFPPGQACISDSQCDNSYPELGITYCADTGYIYGDYGGTQHCCRYEGGSCGGPLSDDHSLCCGNLLCLGGICSSQSSTCTGEGCACQLYRDPGCMASCPLYDPCDPGLVCTGTSEDVGTCVSS
jgi:hypothetical protein